MSDGTAVWVALGAGFVAAFLVGVALGWRRNRQPPWLRTARRGQDLLGWAVGIATFLVVYGLLRWLAVD